MNKFTTLLALTTCLAISVGCPTPTEPPGGGAPGADQPGDAPPPQEGPAADAPTDEQAQNPLPAGAQNPLPAGAQNPLPAGERPNFATFIEGESITVTVTIVGSGEGQIDFTDMSDSDHPRALHVEPFSGAGTVTITAPASYPDTLVVMASTFGDAPTGCEPQEITLGDTDMALTLTLTPVTDDAVPPRQDHTAPAAEPAPAEPAEAPAEPAEAPAEPAEAPAEAPAELAPE